MGKIVIVIIIVITGFFVISLVSGAILALITGSRKKRSLFIAKKMFSFSDDAKSMIFDVLKFHKAGEIEKVNSIIITSKNTLNEILSSLQVGHRPVEFSSGKIGDEISFNAYKKEFQENGYSAESAILLASLFLFELDSIF